MAMRPEELQQDFDFHFTEAAKRYEKETDGATAIYKGKRGVHNDAMTAARL